MSKRKLDQIAGEYLWDIEEAFYVNKRGFDPEKARTFVILHWLWRGDLHPLAAAISEGHQLDQAVLNLLAILIYEGRVTIKPRKGGAPKKLGKAARDIAAALLYENHSGNSDEAFAEIADAIGMGEESVRQAVTAWRESNK
jgi:hypothetical protein